MSERGITTASSLAMMSGVSNATVSRWVAGEDYEPTLDNLRKIAQALDVPFAEIAIQSGVFSPNDLQLPGTVVELAESLRDARNYVLRNDQFSVEQKQIYLAVLDGLRESIRQAPVRQKRQGRVKGG